MKHTTKSIALALSLATLATTSLPVLGASVDVRVIGSITPAACTPTVGGGGTIDYGHIHPSTLSPTDYKVLPVMSTAFSITCDAPAKVAIVAKNGRMGSLAGAVEGVTGAAPSPVTLLGTAGLAVVGLGLDGSAKIGGYAIALKPSSVLADGVAVGGIQRNADWSTWDSTLIGSLYNNNIDRHSSWAATGTLDPIAFETLSGELTVQAYLNHASELDLTKPVVLDGLTTLELIYL
ncbi:Beta-fimbriae probable major subunit [Pseudomonas synxantha]|uniref:Beta-fimbriae probable major subunit n=1 Tax=Pseudomonas synxantha TaxID=47883 RepID=A0A3G7UC21_9PSED|nr:DUF1120 domain-containing protein [Pseudomonas synxantha]AZE56917.1 Beta-fimbriae probable major subunit [Pseudomonas synxantha]